MKSDLVHSKVQLEKDILDRLVTEVKETVATDVQLPNVKKTANFSVIKLWNMRRSGRYATVIGNRPARIVNGIRY